MYTELEGVNRLLTFTGEAPISSITSLSASAATALETLRFTAKSVGSEARLFNTEKYTATPDSADSYRVRLASNVVDVLPYVDADQHRFVIRESMLYDTVTGTSTLDPALGWPTTFDIRIVKLLPFDSMPPDVQGYVIAKALMAHVTPMGDSALLQGAAQEVSMTQVTYNRFLLRPGRYQVLDPHTQQFFWRTKTGLGRLV